MKLRFRLPILILPLLLCLWGCAKSADPATPDGLVEGSTAGKPADATPQRSVQRRESPQAASTDAKDEPSEDPASAEPEGQPDSQADPAPEPAAPPKARAAVGGRSFSSPSGLRFVSFDGRGSRDGFWMGVYEVTQAQYEAVAGANPSRTRGESRPVEMVSWMDAIAFANRLSVEEGLETCYGADGTPVHADVTSCDGYRLPTDAEWRHAAAGLVSEASDRSDIQSIGWIETNALGKHHEVGSRTASPAGLFDLVGNVAEWVHEGWARGGGWDTEPGEAAGPARRELPKTKRDPAVGIRLARSL